MPRASTITSLVVLAAFGASDLSLAEEPKIDAAGNVISRGSKPKAAPKRKLPTKTARIPKKRTRPEGWKQQIEKEEGDATFKIHWYSSGKKLIPRIRTWIETKKIPVATYRFDLFIEKPPRRRGGKPIRVRICRRDVPVWSPGDRDQLVIITTTDPGCENFVYKDESNFVLTATPLDERNRPISLRKVKGDKLKNEVRVEWSDRPKYFLYSAGTYVGMFGLGSSGQDARTLASGPQAAVGAYGRAKWSFLNLGVGVDMAPFISYTNETTGQSQSAPWIRFEVGGGWEFDFIRSEAFTLVFHAEGWLDYTFHNPGSIFQSNFSDHLSIFNIGAYGGATIFIWNYEFKGVAGFLFGPQSVAKGPALRIDVKTDYYWNLVRFVGLARARWINWSLSSNGVAGNNFEASVGLGAEFYLNY